MKLLFLNLGGVEITLIAFILAFFLYCLVDAFGNRKLTSEQRILWVVVIFCLPLFGSIAYLAMGRNPKVAAEEDRYIKGS